MFLGKFTSRKLLGKKAAFIQQNILPAAGHLQSLAAPPAPRYTASSRKPLVEAAESCTCCTSSCLGAASAWESSKRVVIAAEIQGWDHSGQEELTQDDSHVSRPEGSEGSVSKARASSLCLQTCSSRLCARPGIHSTRNFTWTRTELSNLKHVHAPPELRGL